MDNTCRAGSAARSGSFIPSMPIPTWASANTCPDGSGNWHRSVSSSEASARVEGGAHTMNRGKIVWAVCFFVLLLSSPLLIVDLVGIQRSVELASGADFWYDGQIYGDLLRLKVALRGLGPAPD